MARQRLQKCLYISALSFLFQPQAQCPSRSPLRHSIKEQINPGGICMTGWKDCMYVTKPGRVSWLPGLCISFPCGFQVSVDRRAQQPFFSSLLHSLASAQSRGVLIEQPIAHTIHTLGWMFTGTGLQQEKQPQKNRLSLKQGTKSHCISTPTSHSLGLTALQLFHQQELVSSSNFHFVCAASSLLPQFTASLCSRIYKLPCRIQNLLPSKFCTVVLP